MPDTDAVDVFAEQRPPPPPGSPSGLNAYWDRPVYDLARVTVPTFDAEWSERHTIYSLLTMALIHRYWNGNKVGATGHYPWRVQQMIVEGRYAGDQYGDRYIGHNIGCVAVDENGEIIDFDFNHNELYNSSAEHAESRLIRRIFSLNQLYDNWQTNAAGSTSPIAYGATFNGTTIYTSLESCAQCSGVMTLANALRVVYLQSDPGQYRIGNMMYNLTRSAQLDPRAMVAESSPPRPKPKYFAPEPVDASLFDFKYKAMLDTAYQRFAAQCMDESNDMYFYKGPNPGDGPKRTDGMTSFLCTDLALDLFRAADADLESFAAVYPAFRPLRSDGEAAAFSNAEALEHARKFLGHAVSEARRGTPHR